MLRCQAICMRAHVPVSGVSSQQEIWRQEKHAQRTERWLRGEQACRYRKPSAADFWTASNILAYLMAGEVSSSLNIAVSILSKERQYTNLGIWGDSVLIESSKWRRWVSDILSPAATRCWCSGGKYTIISHNPRSQIRNQEKMDLLIQEKTSQVLKHDIVL